MGSKGGCMSKSDRRITAVFSPAYCLFTDGSRLTRMNELCVKQALYYFRTGQARWVIFGCAYDFWTKEGRLKRNLTRQEKVPDGCVVVVGEVCHRYDEVRRLKRKLEEMGVQRLIFVGERHHLGRQFRKSLERALPGLEVHFDTIVCDRFEPTLEPDRIKRFRASCESAWRLWNWVVELVTPIYLRYRPL